jgi:hypothetical protein
MYLKQPADQTLRFLQSHKIRHQAHNSLSVNAVPSFKVITHPPFYLFKINSIFTF